MVFKASFANMSFNFTQILQLSNNCWFLWLICHLQFCHILDTFGLSVIYSFVPDRTLLAFLSFTVLPYIGHFWLICHLQFCPRSDTWFFLSFTVLPYIGHFWLICHLQFCPRSDNFGLSVIYSFSQIRCIRLTYHLQVLPQIGHICILFI